MAIACSSREVAAALFITDVGCIPAKLAPGMSAERTDFAARITPI